MSGRWPNTVLVRYLELLTLCVSPAQGRENPFT